MRNPTSSSATSRQEAPVRRTVLFTAYTGIWTHRLLVRAMQLNDVQVVHVFAQPPRATPGSALPPIESTKIECQRREVPFTYIASANDDAFRKLLAELNPDWAWSFGYGEIFREAVLSIPHAGFFNFHPSLLPAHKGPDPFTSVLFEQEAQTGLSVHEVVAVIDGGRLLYQRPLDVASDDDYLRLMLRLGQFAASELPSIVSSLAQSRAIAPTHLESSYFRKLAAKSFMLSLDDNPEAVLRKSRSSRPSNPLHLDIEGLQVVIRKFMFSDDVVYHDAPVGSVVENVEGFFTLKMNGFLLTVFEADIPNLDGKVGTKEQLRAMFSCGRKIL